MTVGEAFSLLFTTRLGVYVGSGLIVIGLLVWGVLYFKQSRASGSESDRQWVANGRRVLTEEMDNRIDSFKEQLEDMEKNFRSQLKEATQQVAANKREMRVLQRTVDAWTRQALLHAKWDMIVTAKLVAAGIDVDPPPSLWPVDDPETPVPPT